VASKMVVLILLAVGLLIFLATTLPRIVIGGRELEKEEEAEVKEETDAGNGGILQG
jgi:hypothetical protein